MITYTSQVLLKISILMSCTLTWLFHHVTHLVILSLAPESSFVSTWPSPRLHLNFRHMTLLFTPFLWLHLQAAVFVQFHFSSALIVQECAGTLLLGSQSSRATKGQQKPQHRSWGRSLLISADLMHLFLMAVACYYFSYSYFLSLLLSLQIP